MILQHFCRVKCAQVGMERDRSGVVENTVPFTYENSESQTGIFGRIERALHVRHAALIINFPTYIARLSILCMLH